MIVSVCDDSIGAMGFHVLVDISVTHSTPYRPAYLSTPDRSEEACGGDVEWKVDKVVPEQSPKDGQVEGVLRENDPEGLAAAFEQVLKEHTEFSKDFEECLAFGDESALPSVGFESKMLAAETLAEMYNPEAYVAALMEGYGDVDEVMEDAAVSATIKGWVLKYADSSPGLRVGSVDGDRLEAIRQEEKAASDPAMKYG